MSSGSRLRKSTIGRGKHEGSGVLQTYQVPVFFVLALAISWGWWVGVYLLPGASLTMVTITPGAFGPGTAAAIVTWGSSEDLRTWAGQVIDWRVAPYWYVLVVGLPALLVLVGKGGSLFLAGAPVSVAVIADRLPQYVPLLVLAIIVGGGQEEPGWRGFALPRLQARHGAAPASLLIGVIWALWHLPLFLMDIQLNASGNFPVYMVTVIGFSFLLTWCYNSTGGSVLLAMALHGSFNAANLFIPASSSVLEQYPLVRDIGYVVAVWVVVVAVVAWGGMEAFSRRGIPSPAVAGVHSD